VILVLLFSSSGVEYWEAKSSLGKTDRETRQTIIRGKWRSVKVLELVSDANVSLWVEYGKMRGGIGQLLNFEVDE